MGTKFVIKNVGGKPAFVLIKCEASIDGEKIMIKNENSNTNYQAISPEQIIKYRALTIEGNIFKKIMNGQIEPDIKQNIIITYGATQKTIGEFSTCQKVKLDIKNLITFSKAVSVATGIWLLESSDSK